MNPYLKGSLIVFASALGAGGAMAATTHDPWAIVVAVIVNISTTLGGLLMQSPLPRKEWTEQERAAKVVPPAVGVKPA